ncbi:MAG: nucleotide exchange factor GrpE [Pararhodobacter sp.]|nr:nucleotide exchange factor GrpE [Pararhodobacter sp.]
MAEPQEQPATSQADMTIEEMEQMDPLAVLEEAQAAFEQERSEMRDRLMRALADLENSRKRGEKDRREAAMYGGTKLARDLLPVYDNLNRALSLVDEDTRFRAKGLVEGLELTLRELTNIFSRHGVELVAPKPGDLFDPHLHEAMFEAPVPNYAAGQIIQVLSDGFRLHDHLLRPAQVGVSSTPAG